MNYPEISPEVYSLLSKAYLSLNNSPLSPTIRALVVLRVSLMNECEYCIRLHTKEANELGIPKEKIEALSSWKNKNIFSEKEKLALEWSESVTRLDKDLSTKRKELIPHFSEREIVDLTFCISLMNAFNRLSISLKG